MNEIILHGGGEHARVVLDGLLSLGQRPAGIFDPKYTGQLMEVPQLGAYREDVCPGALALVAIGDNMQRKKAVAITRHPFTNFIHGSVVMSKFATLGVGNMIMQGVIVQVNTAIGNHCILNTGAKVDHDCKIGDYVHIAPGAILCGTIVVEEGAFIGAGAVIVPGIKVGAWSTIGAGAVVIHDVPAGSTVVGNPAQPINKS